MIAKFKGITQGVVGKKLPADTTLNNMKKPELIKLLHVAQHNYEVLNGFYTEAVNVNIGKLNSFTEEHDRKIRDKVIEEFVEEAVKQFTEFDLKHGYPTVTDCEDILKTIAEEMKEVEE